MWSKGDMFKLNYFLCNCQEKNKTEPIQYFVASLKQQHHISLYVQVVLAYIFQ